MPEPNRNTNQGNAPAPTNGPAGEPSKEWYAKGLRFDCTQCGQCCTGPPGHVGFTNEEAHAIARHLGLDDETFRARYTQRTPNGQSLAEVRTEHGFDCIFLDRTTLPGKAICGIYQHRPTQCRTFPWWPENLKSRNHWEALARTCEGVGRGNFVPIETIRIQRDAQARTDASV